MLQNKAISYFMTNTIHKKMDSNAHYVAATCLPWLIGTARAR